MVSGGALHHRQLTITVCLMRPERVWSILLSDACFCETVDSRILTTWTFCCLEPNLSNIEQAAGTFLLIMIATYNW